MSTVYLIDGNSYLYRAFYAIRGLTAPDGTPTNAIYGFTTMILKVLREKKPDYFSVVFDAPGPTYRHETYKEYKANRPGMPDDLKSQVPLIKEIIGAFGIHRIEMPGYEADDILAHIARDAESRGHEVFIVTGDKDMCQVVSPKIKLYDTMKDRVTAEEDVIEKYGVKPSQFPEVLALMGDASDNIPGAPGIGEKTAVRLLKEFGDLSSIIDHHEKIKNTKARNAVSRNIENIKLSLELATIHPEVPAEISLSELQLPEPDWQALKDYFRRFQFSSLIKLLPEQESSSSAKTEYVTILEAKMLTDIIAAIHDEVTVDTETTSTDPMLAELVGVSLSTTPEKAYYIPVAHAYPGAPEQLRKSHVIKQLKGVLENPRIFKSGHNIKYDAIVLRNEGIDLRGISFDTMLASYLLNPNRANHNLTDAAMEHLGIKKITYKDIMGKGKKDFREVSVEDATTYSGEDAAATLMLKQYFEPLINKEELEKLFYEVEIPLIEVLADMEMAGVKIDLSLMESFSRQLSKEMASIEQRIYFIAGGEFNINSPKQLQEILFDKIGLKPTKKTKTGYSTNSDVLEQLALQHELPREIIEYRGLSKLRSTYVDALPRLINEKTGRLHTSFNQTVTATGRLSSSDPNLQNIPIRGEWGKKIREAFIAEKGNLLLSSDYSQIELRLFAHLSQDELLIETFSQDGDIHRRTAGELFGVPPEKVTSEMRRVGKTVNFGIVYGISPYGLSQQLVIPLDEAKQYIDIYFSRHSGVRKYMEKLIGEAAERGYVTTILNRKRAIPELRSSNRNIRQLGERLAINTPMQGSAADIIKVAMIKIWKRLKSEGLQSHILLQVHDELLLEVPEKEKDTAQQLVREEMERAVTLSVPLRVDIGIGKNWAEAH